MKAGVLTFHRATNYGTALQALATVQVLRALGVDAELIDYRPGYIERTVKPLRLCRAGSLKEAASILVNRLTYGNQHEEKIGRFLRFLDQIPQGTTVCQTAEMAAKEAQGYDVVVSGSDQLWNERITGQDMTYFLPFAHPKKVSFASSFGVSQLSPERKAAIAPLLQDFTALSVREETALRLVGDMLEGMKQEDAPALYRVADPTLLLDAEDWKRYMQPVEDLPKDGYILTYYMIETDALRAVTEKLQKETGLSVVNIKPSKRQMLRREGKNMMWAGPAELLSCYAGASYVVTNSFHGTAFAINFEVPMYVTPLPVSMAGEVNSRLVELLAWYGLSDRWIASASDAGSMDVECPMTGLGEIKRKRKEESMGILKTMLG